MLNKISQQLQRPIIGIKRYIKHLRAGINWKKAQSLREKRTKTVAVQMIISGALEGPRRRAWRY